MAESTLVGFTEVTKHNDICEQNQAESDRQEGAVLA